MIDNIETMLLNQAKTIAKQLEAIKVMRDALKFECGNRCAEQNKCNAREAIEEADKILGE